MSEGTSVIQEHLFLTGFRGTGKTTVARRLADILEAGLYDLDNVIQQRVGKTIAEIFSEEGEASFRNHETECLREIALLNPAVISLGGGAILRQENREIIANSGRCVWLRAEAKTIVARLNADQASRTQRPALTNLPVEEEVETLLRTREETYRETADYIIATDTLSVDELAERILDWWVG